MKRNVLALLLTLAMLINLVPVTALAAAGAEATATQNENRLNPAEKQEAIAAARPDQADGSDQIKVDRVDSLPVDTKTQTGSANVADASVSAYAPTDPVRVMIVLDTEAMADQVGYDRTRLASAGAVTEAQAMERAQNAVVQQIQLAVNELLAGSECTVQTIYHYTTVINGVSVQMPYGALDAVRAMDSVESAFVVPTYSVPEDMTSATADPTMVSTQIGFGSAEAWDVGYTGAGMKIAIIDTGLDSDHPSFADAPADPSMDQDDIEAVLTQLNAYERFSSGSAVKLKASSLYRSEKVAYGFNYVDNTLNITHDRDTQGDHGTHVAGITAANRIDSTDVAGVAPDAQLLIMKVFGVNGGAYWDDIVAALEDSILLGADAVNMSLGSPAGFDVSDESLAEFNEYADAIYAKVEACDMILAVAAGNSYSAAYGTPLGTDKNLASNPDNGIVSSPGTYPSATMVASVENDSVLYNYITAGEQQIPYTDVAGYNFIDTLTAYGQSEYPYVMIGGYGTAEDFGDYNWENDGKIAVVSRGSLAFTDKQANAAAAGFSALIVYNNLDDGLMNMQDDGILPNIFVSSEGGAALSAAADENGEGTLTVETGMIMVKSDTAGQMSDFSSWGVSPDLELTPDVTAPGGNIFSSIDGGLYGVMSGTSMATPHIAGMSALVLEYLRNTYEGQSDTWYRTVAEALIMSTAQPITENTGVLYSPRKQGAGSANVMNAVSARSYLTVDGTTPKISFGDDDDKTGVYTFSFEINNLTDAPASYTLDGTALTDQVQFIDGVAYMGETARKLNGTFSFDIGGVAGSEYDYNGNGVFDLADVQDFLDDVNCGETIPAGYDLNDDGTVNTADVQSMRQILKLACADVEMVTVPANGSVTVTATLTLSSEDKTYMDVNYANGIYVDGFVRCYAAGDETDDLSLPFMGFYGDWSAAPVFDDEAWDLTNATPSRYWNVLWTDSNYSYTLGDNPYVTEARSDEHNVLSPNGDGYQDTISDIYLGLLRNAKKLVFSFTDENGDVVQRITENNVRKAYYNSSYGLCIPYIYSNYGTEDFLNFKWAEELEQFTFSIEAWLDDGDDVVDDVYSVPIVIDTSFPVADADSFAFINHPNNGRQLAFDVSDNYDIAAVITLTEAGSIIDVIPVNTRQAGEMGESATISLDVSKYDTDFYVAVCDYGFNESYYHVTFEGEQNVDPDAFYGYRQTSVVPYGSYNYVTTAYNGWYSFTDASSMLMHTDAYYSGEAAVQAAEYVDGWVIGIDENGSIFAMKAGQWERNVFGQMPYANEYATEPMVAMDMAYDYTTNTMYVITDEEYNGSGAYLLTLDILTGEVTQIGMLTGFANNEIVYDWGYTYVQTYGQALTLACDNEGVLYAINHADGDLYTVDPATCEATLVGATGYQPKYYQSMTVDHDTDTLYWAAYQSYSGTSHFYQVDKTTGAVKDVTSSGIQHNAEMTALFKPNLNGGDVIPDGAELTGITLNAQELSMANGTTASLQAAPVPYYAQLGTIEWTSGDDSIATVDEGGMVTGVSEGTVTITASCNGLTASCEIQVVYVEGTLTFHDATNLTWMNFQANAPQEAVDAQGMTPYETTYNYFISAAYAHGSVYAYDYYGGFYKMDSETLQGTRLGVNNQINGTNGLMLALTYNYADGFLYGIAQEVETMWDSYFYLVRVNPANGSYEKIQKLDTDTYGYMYNLAVDYDGTFYSIVDVYDYATWASVSKVQPFTVADGEISYGDAIALTDFTASDSATVSSLVWSEDNGCLFWADYYGLVERIDPATGENLVLGAAGTTTGNESISNTCLFIHVDPQTEPEAPQDVEITELTMQSKLQLLKGSSITVSVAVEPWNAATAFTYEIADTAIATVDEKGVITGVSQGTTTLTVTEAGGRTLTASVIVAPSTGNLYAMVVQDLNYGANYFASFADTAPADVEVAYDFSGTSFAPYSGAYYDGYLYTYAHVVDELIDSDGYDYAYRYYMLKIDPADYSYEILGNNRRIHETIMDMAVDYTSGTMYGVAYNAMAASTLVQISMETGAVTAIATTGQQDLRAMTFDADGRLYAISADGGLYQVDQYTGDTTLVGATGCGKLDGYQSMYYDFETGNTYWAQYGSDGSNGLMLVDLQDGTATNMGSVCGVGATVACLYSVSDNDPSAPAAVEANGIAMAEKQTVVAGQSISLNATVLPVSAAQVNGAVTWTSGNTAVATVDSTGTVTGVAAGTAVITASVNGYSAECTVTVTAEARRFYAYDETDAQWISFTADDPTDIRVERADSEDESGILASLYRNGKLYSFTRDGKYWSVDPETFERTLISEDFAGLYAGMEIADWWGNVETNYYELMPLSMAYDEAADQAYVQLMAYEVFDYGYDFYSFYSLLLVPIDLETGAVDFTTETISMMDYDTWESYEVDVHVIDGDYYQTEAAFTNAVMVNNGVAVFINTFDSGLVTYWDLESGETMEVALVYNYWGNAEHSRSLYEDPLTGEIYVIRDMKDWGGDVTINTITLSDADVTSLGSIGNGYNTVNSLFIK